jgi:hypothetical protein
MAEMQALELLEAQIDLRPEAADFILERRRKANRESMRRRRARQSWSSEGSQTLMDSETCSQARGQARIPLVSSAGTSLCQKRHVRVLQNSQLG